MTRGCSFQIGVRTAPSVCRHLAKVELTTVGEVLQYYPRDYQTCEYALRDGQYATVVGTVVKNDGRAMRERSCMDITLEVDPDFLREMDPDNDAEISGDGAPPSPCLSEPAAFAWSAGSGLDSSLWLLAVDSPKTGR